VWRGELKRWLRHDIGAIVVAPRRCGGIGPLRFSTCGDVLHDLRISFASGDGDHVRALNGVDAHARRPRDEPFMLRGAHAPIDVEAFGAHPATDEHDHGVLDAGGVQRCGETSAE
jgi:hypothetical protein